MNNQWHPHSYLHHGNPAANYSWMNLFLWPGQFSVFPNEGDQGGSGTWQAPVASVHKTQLPAEIHPFHIEQCHFSGFHLVLRETLADDGYARICPYETFDHADA